MSVTLEQQIACLRRELALRERVYPKWVASGRMTPVGADRELDAMRAALQTLVRVAGCTAGGAL